MTDVALIKAALKELGEDATLEKVAKWVAAKKTLDQVASGEGDAPADPPAAASVDTTEAVKAAVETPPVTAADVPPSEPITAADPAAGMADALLQGIAEKAGMPIEAVIAAIQERMDEFVAWLAGTPDSGTGADAEVPMARDVAAVANARITALSRKVDDGAKALKAATDEIAALKHEKVLARIDAAIEAGHIEDVQRDKMVRLSRSAPDLLDEFLGDAAKKPAVTPNPIVAAPAKREATSHDTREIAEDDELFKTYFNTLGHVKDPDKRRALAMERASAFLAKADTDSARG